MYIQFFPTFRCNESCSFCFNQGISAGPDIPVSDFRRLADILSGEGIAEIDILGGEPALHPGLISLVDIACSKGLAVSVSTNGSNVATLKSLSENFGRGRLSIGISLNEDNICESLVAFVNEWRPMLKSVSTKERFLPSCAFGFLENPDMKYYAIFMDTMSGCDLKNSLSFPQYLRTLNKLKDRYGSFDGVYCGGFVPDVENHPVLSGIRCPAGTTKLSVTPDGSVYPCYLFFRRPEFRLGNILEVGIEKILKNPVLDSFRKFGGNKCPESSCELFPVCHGGCPAVSLMVNGSLHAPDPRCVNNRNLQ